MKTILFQKKQLLLISVLGLFTACNSSSDIVDNDDRFDETTMLEFASEEDYQSLVDSLSNVSYEELEAWSDKQKFETFFSYFKNAEEEILSAQSEDEYASKRSNYEGQFIFNDKDLTDYTVYSPVNTIAEEVLLNKEGNVKIGNQIVNKFVYNSSNYPFPTQSAIHRSVESGVNSIYIGANHRRIRVQYSSYLDNQCKFYVSARKKFLGGWASYNTTVYLKINNSPFLTITQTKGTYTYWPHRLADGVKIQVSSSATGTQNVAILTVKND